MNNASSSSVLLSVLALAIAAAAVGCAESAEPSEEQGETSSNLSCKRVPLEVEAGGRVVKTSRIVCDGSNGAGSSSGASTSSCTVNGRKMVCEGGGCRAINGQPGSGCRWADEGAEDDDRPEPAPAPTPAPTGEADGESSCTINGRKAICANGNCISVNGQPGPGCRFAD